MERLTEIYHADTVITMNTVAEQLLLTKLSNHIKNHDNLVAIGDNEVNLVLETDVVEEIYWQSDRKLEPELIEKARKVKAKIAKISQPMEYGHILALLRYPLDLTQLMEVSQE